MKLVLSTFFIAIIVASNSANCGLCPPAGLPDYPNYCFPSACCVTSAHCCFWNSCCDNITGNKVEGISISQQAQKQIVK